ncbi:DUF2505 domain-containing protein [Tomitella cavernea]|uniref:DUF2505 domain-containing protein n=1 Tax=Tomitella cavernea TaxID=1387982 RepID=A0ABP9D235_9ACTN|nr:DUF2505 domain-containing protein [Tomitella cavernea]
MPRRIEYSARLSGDAARTYAALSDRAYWDGLMEQLREFTPVSVVESFESGDGGIRVEMTQVIAREMMPAVAQTVLQTDLVITRRATFGRYTPGGVTTGSFSATIPAAPGSLGGDVTLTDDAGGSVLHYTPAARVNIPFVGGKLEDVILENLVNLFGIEKDFTNHWLRSRN